MYKKGVYYRSASHKGYLDKRMKDAMRSPDRIVNVVNPPRTQKEVRGVGLLPPGLGRKGYDSDYWPFSIRKAVSEKGYRRGVIAASMNPAYNSAWRAETEVYLGIVYKILIGKLPEVEAPHRWE